MNNRYNNRIEKEKVDFLNRNPNREWTQIKNVITIHQDGFMVEFELSNYPFERPGVKILNYADIKKIESRSTCGLTNDGVVTFANVWSSVTRLEELVDYLKTEFILTGQF